MIEHTNKKITHHVSCRAFGSMLEKTPQTALITIAKSPPWTMVGNMEDGATLRLPKIEATENELIKHVKGIIIDQLWNVDLLDLQTPSYSGLPLALEVWICPS